MKLELTRVGLLARLLTLTPLKALMQTAGFISEYIL